MSQPHTGLARHFTATGFVVKDDAMLLHWHLKVGAWLPPGGHVEADEDPVQAVTREVLEETGVTVEVVGSAPDLGLSYPAQVAPPFTIMIEDIHDPVEGPHQHIDMIYFCRPIGIGAGTADALNDDWQWVSREDLADGVALGGHGGEPVPPPDDVRLLAERAFRVICGEA